MVEGTGLENRHTGEPGIESSNLSLSAEYKTPARRLLSESTAPAFLCGLLLLIDERQAGLRECQGVPADGARLDRCSVG